MSAEALINKYRPLAFEEIAGHEAVVAALQRALASASHPHAFLLTGPSGVGKTTLARIIATTLQAEVIELDAASNSGIDAMREVVELGYHRSLSGAGRRFIILDEAHSLSRPAWQPLLKLLEEPPTHFYMALCTTELAKVPETIQTRCYHIVLGRVPLAAVEDLLHVVCECEGWEVAQEVLALVVTASTGQPRKALSLLQAVYDAPSRSEAGRIISLIEAGEPLVDLTRALLDGVTSWTRIQSLLAKIDDDDFDSASVHMGRYLTAVIARAESEGAARRAFTLLDALVFPSATYDKKAAFFAAMGRMLWTE